MNVTNYLKEIMQNARNTVVVKILLLSLPLLIITTENVFLDLILIAYTLIISYKLRLDELFLLYIYMFFFEEVTVVNILGGSLSRIIMVILLIKLSITFFKNRMKLDYKAIFILIFFILSCIVGIIARGLDFGDISIVINIAVIILYRAHLNRKKDIKSFAINLKEIILYAVFVSIIYGLIHMQFLQEITANLVTLRFRGTYEPNFMAFFLNIGLVVLMFDREKYFNKNEKIFFGVIFLTALWMTKSMTGYIVFVFIFIYFLFSVKQFSLKKFIIARKKILIIFTLIGTLLLGGSVYYLETLSNTSDEVQTDNRFLFLYETLKKGDLDTFSSGRISIIESFASESINRPMIEVFLGNGPSSKPTFVKFFEKDKFAHNSYIDFLYSFGILGGLICIIYICKTIYNKKMFNKELAKYDAFIVMRYVCLIFALTLSLYSKRLVLLLFLF